MAIKETPLTGLASILSLAIAMNGFFIKRLVDQIDATNKIALEVQADVKVIKAQLAFGGLPFKFERRPALFKEKDHEKTFTVSNGSSSSCVR